MRLEADAAWRRTALDLGAILRLIERYGALGAKSSTGQGVIRLVQGVDPQVPEQSKVWLEELRTRPAKVASNPVGAPSLDAFLGATVELAAGATAAPNWWRAIPLDGIAEFISVQHGAPTWIPAAPAVRAELRSWLRTPSNFPRLRANLTQERHRLMGVVLQPDGPKGSDVFVTHMYQHDGQWRMRLFGFVPNGGNEVAQGLRNLLRDRDQLLVRVQAALGLEVADVTPYPETAPELLGVPKEAAHA